MKEKISELQFCLLIANFIVTSLILSFPQVLGQVGEQNAWFVPFCVFPIISFLILIGLGKKEKIGHLENLLDRNQKSFLYICFFLTTEIFLVFLFIKDFRAVVDFILTVLLPATPIEVTSIVLSLTLIYIASSGLEVIARITVVQFILIAFIAIFLPFLLLNEIQLDYLQPFGGENFLKTLGKSIYMFTPWVGEAIIVFLLVTEVNTSKKIRLSSILGVGLSLALVEIILLLDITVLGMKVLKETTYPSLTLIQQINITDFLDRLDLVIVTLWLPTYIAKLALILYGINKMYCRFRGAQSNLLIAPISLLLGVLSVLLFNKNVDHLEYTFFTWGTLGLGLELAIVGLFVMLRLKYQKTTKA